MRVVEKRLDVFRIEVLDTLFEKTCAFVKCTEFLVAKSHVVYS